MLWGHAMKCGNNIWRNHSKKLWYVLSASVCVLLWLLVADDLLNCCRLSVLRLGGNMTFLCENYCILCGKTITSFQQWMDGWLDEWRNAIDDNKNVCVLTIIKHWCLIVMTVDIWELKKNQNLLHTFRCVILYIQFTMEFNYGGMLKKYFSMGWHTIVMQ